MKKTHHLMKMKVIRRVENNSTGGRYRVRMDWGGGGGQKTGKK